MKVRIQRWGNSLALRIPKSFAVEAGMDQDVEVDLSLVDGKLVISPVGQTWTLDGLLEGIRPENLHEGIDSGPAVGAELW
jgi:antitoxin MazE